MAETQPADTKNNQLMKLSAAITRFIDLFYIGPFKKMPRQMFRYAFCGGGNLLLNWVLYWFVHNYVVAKRFFDLGFVVMSPHIATLLVVFPVTFFTGFWLQKHVAFVSSPLRTRTQLVRYLLSVAGSLLINYLGLKLFVEALHIYPTPSQMMVSLLTIAYSYLMQNHFTFRGHKGE